MTNTYKENRGKLHENHFNVALMRNEAVWHSLHIQRLVLVTVSSVRN